MPRHKAPQHTRPRPLASFALFFYYSVYYFSLVTINGNLYMHWYLQLHYHTELYLRNIVNDEANICRSTKSAFLLGKNCRLPVSMIVCQGCQNNAAGCHFSWYTTSALFSHKTVCFGMSIGMERDTQTMDTICCIFHYSGTDAGQFALHLCYVERLV